MDLCALKLNIRETLNWRSVKWQFHYTSFCIWSLVQRDQLHLLDQIEKASVFIWWWRQNHLSDMFLWLKRGDRKRATYVSHHQTQLEHKLLQSLYSIHWSGGVSSNIFGVQSFLLIKIQMKREYDNKFVNNASLLTSEYYFTAWQTTGIVCGRNLNALLT